MKINDILTLSKVFFNAISEKMIRSAKLAGKGLKEYLSDEENIRHVSLVVYDLMPLTVKIGLRHEKFHEQFKFAIGILRKQLFHTTEDSSSIVPVEPSVLPKKVNKTIPTKKVIKSIAKPIKVKVVTKKPSVKTANKKIVVKKKAGEGNV